MSLPNLPPRLPSSNCCRKMNQRTAAEDAAGGATSPLQIPTRRERLPSHRMPEGEGGPMEAAVGAEEGEDLPEPQNLPRIH